MKMTIQNSLKNDGIFVVIDTETSGLKSFENGLIQIGSVALNSTFEIIDTFDYIVCPPTDTVIVEESLQISRITREQIKNGLSYREVCEKYTQFIHKNFPEKPIVIAQFFPFDYGFLEQVFTTAYKEPKINYEISQFPFQDLLSRNIVDTKTLANAINIKHKLCGKNPIFTSTSLSGLGGLKETLGIPVDMFVAHDALGDCLATREVLIRLLKLIDC